MVKFEWVGNWVAVSRSFKQLPKLLQSSGVYGQRRAAEQIVKIVKAHINNQDLGWAPRTERSVAGDPRILVNTEAYYGAIKAWKKGDEYYAGVPKDSHNAQGTSIVQYALAHEYGLGDMPQRPLWEPSFKEIGVKRGLKRLLKLPFEIK